MSAQGSPEREQWFLSNELAQEHARQYLAAEIGEKREVLAHFVDDWITRSPCVCVVIGDPKRQPGCRPASRLRHSGRFC